MKFIKVEKLYIMKKISKKTKTKKVPFSQLSPEKKRVAIARDVLEQIRIGRYISNGGSYIDALLMKDGKDKWDMSSLDIKSNFGKIKNCKVCAMGACLMSITKFENKLDFYDIGNDIENLNNEKTKILFQSIFSPEQLLLIERAFEGKSGGTTVGVNIFSLSEDDFKNKINKCQKFYKKFELKPKKDATIKEKENRTRLNHQNRMIAIMRNLIKNNGTFKL